MARWCILTAFSLLTLACSGSSSESPWPVEPLDGQTDPVGESRTRGNVLDPSTIDDRYTPGAGGEGGGRELDLDEP